MWNDKSCIDLKFFLIFMEILFFFWLKGNYGSFWVDLKLGELFYLWES